ncbi:sigma-70 family RNA polymerase sigma factor [Methylibium rhizosphaerae]|uniref:sigma-70 family RNA polymerase sigma factor n=1 Tax=Methylibium rhizosphaerae TaxID=2570323 RepID=UPI00112A0C53|nr:sigma-70 family RNA polymerase sigma factor [Methylibium rhizosphaerae]
MTQLEASDDQQLWAAYQRQPTAQAREALVERYRRLVRMLAAKAFSHRFCAELEFDDYLHFGMVGLLESIDRFRADGGAKFETYASRRITGAILDGVESLSEKQQQIAARQRMLKERSASLGEAAREAPAAHAFERLAEVALGLAVGFLLEGTGMYAAGDEATPDHAYQTVELRQLRRDLHDAVQGLPPQERLVIERHYMQQQPFDQIAATLGLTKGRISQVHHSGLRRLRGLLRGHSPPAGGDEP